MLISLLGKHGIVCYKFSEYMNHKIKDLDGNEAEGGRNLSFQIRIFNIFETWPHAISVSISWPVQDKGRYIVQKQLCPSKPLFLYGNLQKS